MSFETFDLIDKLRRSGRPAAMATLVRTVGTSPRKEGAKMFVADDGSIFGSVTIGGCVDARVIEESGRVLDASNPRLLNLKLGDEEAWEIGFTCGGAVDVFVERFSDAIADVYRDAKTAWDRGETVAIATVLEGSETGSRFLLRDRARWPALSGIVTIDNRESYVELLRPPARLVIFGGGAVGIPLVRFAKELGFHATVVDSRPRFANRERFPSADAIHVGIPSEIAEQMNLGRATPVVVIAHDAKIEIPVLTKALASDAPYIGVLGSRKRGAALLNILRENGASESDLARIRVPVGLDIGAESSAEIALSVVAEILAVMRGHSGAPLSAKR